MILSSTQSFTLTMTDTGESSSSGTIVALAATNTAADRGIAKEDLIELIRAVKFKNPDFSQRQVHTEIVTEIPIRFPQYAKDLSPQSLSLNDVKKAWKKAILQQAQPSNSGSNGNGNADLVERLKSLSTNPQLYTIGLDGGEVGSSSAAREYVAKFMEEEQLAHSAKERELLEDYVHVFLDVPADSSVAKKPHQALINFQSNSAKTKANPKGTSNKKKKGIHKKKIPTAAAAEASSSSSSSQTTTVAAPFGDAIVVKIQMAAPLDANDTARHPMLLYDKTRTYKTFVHPESTLTGTKDGYSRLAEWIRKQGVGGALGNTGGTKAYFYGRLTKTNNKQKILSIYVKELAPIEAQDF